MSCDCVVMRGGNETPRAIIEGQIFSFNRQEVYHRFDHTAFQKARNATVSARHAMAEIHWIPGKNFVPTVTSEGYRHMLARKARQQISWDQRWVTHGLIHPRAYFAHQVCGQAGAESLFMVIGAEELGDRAGILRFVKRRFRK